METLLGFAIIYSWIHFAVIKHNKNYKKRDKYEKVVIWFAGVGFVLFIIGTLM